MQKKMIAGILSIALAIFMVSPVMAEKGTNVSDEKAQTTSEEARSVKDLELAARLAEYGRRTNDPAALLVSAQIMKNTPAKEEKREKTTEGKKAETTAKKDSAGLTTPDALLAEAKEMAKSRNNHMVLEMIEKESKVMAQRGKAGSPVRHVDRVEAGLTDVFEGIVFRGREKASIGVVSDGDCDLDLFVYDENGNLIEKDTDYDPHCLVEFTPKWTGPFTIKVKNLGRVYADYVLVSN